MTFSQNKIKKAKFILNEKINSNIPLLSFRAYNGYQK